MESPKEENQEKSPPPGLHHEHNVVVKMPGLKRELMAQLERRDQIHLDIPRKGQDFYRVDSKGPITTWKRSCIPVLLPETKRLHAREGWVG